MLHLAICDDEPSFIDIISGYANSLAEEMGLSVSISSYTQAEDCAAHAAENDILFLDIQIGESNGIDTARKIRSVSKKLSIVFMTNYLQYAVEGYSVRAYRYLLKPISYTQFKSEIADLFTEVERNQGQCFTVSTQSGQYTIRKDEILYIETIYGKKITIHTAESDITQYSSINTWEKQLGADFFRVHNSCLVHMGAIAAVRQDMLELKGGTLIPLSKYRKKDFMTAYTHYLGIKL